MAFISFKKFNVTSLSDPRIHDAFSLTLFKYIKNINELSIIPRQVYYYILLFLHESIYGADSAMPYDSNMWSIEFVRLLRKFNMERTEEFFVQYQYDQGWSMDFWKENCPSFRCTSSLNDLRARVPREEILRLSHGLDNSHIMFNDGFEVVSYESFHWDFSEKENLLQIFKAMCKLHAFNQPLFDRIKDYPGDVLVVFNDTDCINLETLKAISELQSWCEDSALQQILTSNSCKPFELDDTQSYVNAIKHLAESLHQNLSHLDIFSKILKSGQFKVDQIIGPDWSPIFFSVSNNHNLFRILLDESTTPVNFFYFNENNLISPYFVFVVDKFKLILNYFIKRTDDPLPLLSIAFDYFCHHFNEEDFVHLMRTTTEFDLIKLYLIDLNPNELVFFGQPGGTLQNIGFTQGMIFSFKHLVNFLESTAGCKLKHLFASDVHVFDELPDQNTENVVPISKFIHKGILEPISNK